MITLRLGDRDAVSIGERLVFHLAGAVYTLAGRHKGGFVTNSRGVPDLGETVGEPPLGLRLLVSVLRLSEVRELPPSGLCEPSAVITVRTSK